MSRSSTRGRWSWLSPPTVAGLSIGREHVSYAQIVKTSQAWGLRHLGEGRMASRLFMGDGSAAAAAVLVPALKTAVGDRPPRFGPLHVSVPDAAVRVSLFELDEVPPSRVAQDAFVQFQMGREPGGATSRHASQLLGRNAAGKHLLLGVALDEPWYRAIAAALGQAGLRAWSLNANAFRQFSLYHDRITPRSGALVVLEPDSWSLAIWDAAGLLRYSRAQWRAEDLDHQEIAAEIERSILGYVHSEGGRTVEQLWVCAGTDTSELLTVLNARASQSCQVLQIGEQLRGADPASRELLRSAASLAAALQA